MDLDLDDIDGPKPEGTRKFAPKTCKFKPKPKVKSLVSKPPSQESNSTPFTGKEELDAKPLLDTKQPLVNSIAATTKTEYEQSHIPVDENSTVKMDVDATLETEEPNEDLMEEDKFKDYVVREIDVYYYTRGPCTLIKISISAKIMLYVLQYPLCPRWRPYEIDDRCEEVRVKSKSREVEMNLSVDIDSKNYDSDASDIVKMTKQVLSTSWKPVRTTGYVVGVLVGNKLHLNPVHSVVQLRPSMKHLEPSGSRKKNIAVEALFQPLKYHDARSDISAKYGRKMVALSASEVPFSMNSHEYVSSLCPTTSNHDTISKGPSRRELLLLPLEDRFKTWFLEGPPIHRFNALKHLASEDSDSDVLGVLQKFGHLIQGLWVPKSSVICAEGQKIEMLARNFILLLFSKSLIISRTQLPQKPELLKHMKEVLKLLATERPSLGDWKFKEPCDVSFIKLHQNLVKKQQQSWVLKEPEITLFVFGKASRPSIKNPSKADVASSSKVGQKNSNRAPSRASMPDAIREALPKALQRLFQAHKVCSFEQICLRLREMAVSESQRPKGGAKELIEAANGVEYREELLEIINKVAIDIHGVFVSRSSTDNLQYDGFRRIVIDLLKAERNAKLKRAAVFEAAKIQLNREPIDDEFRKVMAELCTSQGSAWVLKSGDGNPK